MLLASTLNPVACVPSAATVLASSSSEGEVTTTSAPSAMKRAATARPIPLVPAVTTARRPSRRPIRPPRRSGPGHLSAPAASPRSKYLWKAM